MRGRGSGRKFFAAWLCHLPSCHLRQVTSPLWSYGELCENRIFLLEARSWLLSCHVSAPLCVYLPKAESGVCALEQAWVLETQAGGSQFSPSLSTEPSTACPCSCSGGFSVGILQDFLPGWFTLTALITQEQSFFLGDRALSSLKTVFQTKRIRSFLTLQILRAVRPTIFSPFGVPAQSLTSSATLSK